MARHRCLLVSCLFLAAISFSVVVKPGWAASVHSLRGREHSESKIDLLLDALAYVNEDAHILERSIANLAEMLAKRGESILAPVGDPPIHPQGKLTKKIVADQVLRVGGQAKTEVDAEVTITEQTTHRFLIQVKTVIRHDGRVKVSSGTGSIGLVQNRQNQKRNLSTGMMIPAPGRYDVLHILVARPIKGGGPATILDVAAMSFEVPMP